MRKSDRNIKKRMCRKRKKGKITEIIELRRIIRAEAVVSKTKAGD